VNDLQNKQAGVGHRVVNVELEAVPPVAFGHIQRDDKEGLVVRVPLFPQALVPRLKTADKPIAQVVVEFLVKVLPKGVVYRFPDDYFSPGSLRVRSFSDHLFRPLASPNQLVLAHPLLPATNGFSCLRDRLPVDG